MDELHQTSYSTYLHYHKIIIIERKLCFWPKMKKDVEGYIARCQKCQQVKVENQHPMRLLQLLSIPEWKWEVILMDFIT